MNVTRDVLQDLIQHTHSLGVIDLLKVTGTKTDTQVTACAEDRTVIVNGKFVNPVLAFEGVFGMPNLPKLKTILGFTDEYDEKAAITVTRQNRNGTDVPATINFRNAQGDFQNDYRLMTQTIVEERVKNVHFKGATWNVNFEPTIAGIGRLKKQASVHSEETVFSTRVVNSNLEISFGDPATHSSNFVFHAGVQGAMSKTLMWPVRQFICIMDLLGDKQVEISEQGAMRITVNTGLAVYEYLLPAQTK